ncbi:MAG: T9SS type A sorting domain-containing protein [bacterium]
MKNFAIIIMMALLFASAVFADQAIYNHDQLVPIKNYSVYSSKASDTVLISPNANWRGICQPGRNVIVRGDTVSVIYSQTTTDPNDFQVFYQAYSTDGGANWTPAQVGTGNCMRTYPHQAQMWDENDTTYPYSATAYAYWLERHYPGTTGETYYAYDELTPFQLFTPVQMAAAITYFPTGVVWMDGHRFGTGCDAGNDDIYGFTSTDAGATWDSTVISPAGSANGQVAPMIDRGDDGYAFMYYGRQEVSNNRIINYYIETTDYGMTWTSPHQMMVVAFQDSLGNPDTLSLSWQGYSSVVDYYNKKPYILAKLDNQKDPSYSYNFGEIYFIKPNGGSAGAWTFDSLNPVVVIDNDPNVFENLSGYPTIGYYYDQSENIVLYGFSLAIIDTMASQYLTLMGLTSTDEGNTWDIQIAAPFLSDSFAWYFPSASYYLDNNNHVHVVCIKEDTHNDPDNLNLYHISFDVVNDLGLPNPGPYTVGVEEQPINVIPSMYNVVARQNSGLCTFELSIPEGARTSLRIYDASGRQVADLVNSYLTAGTHNISWNADVSSGNYIYRMTSGGYSQSGKIFITQ